MDLQKEVGERMKESFPKGEWTMDSIDGKHWGIEVKDACFSGKTLVEQHKMVYAALEDLINDGYLHAIKIKTRNL